METRVAVISIIVTESDRVICSMNTPVISSDAWGSRIRKRG